MAKFRVLWTLEGSSNIEAKDKADAQKKVDAGKYRINDTDGHVTTLFIEEADEDDEITVIDYRTVKGTVKGGVLDISEIPADVRLEIREEDNGELYEVVQNQKTGKPTEVRLETFAARR